MSTSCPPYQFTVRIECASMGCVFPFLWEETVSQFIPDSWKSLCNPGETQFKEFLLHGPGLPNARVRVMSHHISFFPYDFDGCHLQKENLGRKRGEDEGRRWERGRGDICVLFLLCLFISPSPFPSSVFPFFY